MELINDKTNGYYEANSNIGQVKIVIKHGIMKVYNTEDKWFFDINDKFIFVKMDDYILLVTDKEKLSGIQIYKPLKAILYDPNEIQDFSEFKKIRKFEVK